MYVHEFSGSSARGRFNGRKVVPTKGGNTDRDLWLTNMASESLLLLMKVQPIDIERTLAGFLTTARSR